MLESGSPRRKDSPWIPCRRRAGKARMRRLNLKGTIVVESIGQYAAVRNGRCNLYFSFLSFEFKKNIDYVKRTKITII
jgi:hypothetical protein